MFEQTGHEHAVVVHGYQGVERMFFVPEKGNHGGAAVPDDNDDAAFFVPCFIKVFESIFLPAGGAADQKSVKIDQKTRYDGSRAGFEYPTGEFFDAFSHCFLRCRLRRCLWFRLR